MVDGKTLLLICVAAIGLTVIVVSIAALLENRYERRELENRTRRKK